MGHLTRRVATGFIAFALITAFCRAETLRLRADPWMPYNGEPGAKYPGFTIELAQAIFAKQGITLDYQNMAWGDALKACADSQIEAVVGANTVEAAKLVVPAESIGSPRVGLFVLKQTHWTYENIPTLVKIRLGVIQDYKYFDSLDAYIDRHKGAEVVRFSGEHPLADALAQLLEGKIDVVVELYPVFAWTARNAGYKPEQFRLAYLHEAEPTYFAFLPGEAGKRYAKIFDDGIRELRANGELAKVLKRYGQEDWKN